MLNQSTYTNKIYERLQVNSDELVNFCRTNLIAELAVFGSVLRDDFSDKSDIDLLITYLPNAPRGLLEKIKLQEKLKKLFNRSVDLVSKTSIEKSKNWLKRQSILNSAEVIYRA